MSINTKSRFPRVSRILSCGSNPETPTKIYSASKSVSLSCCRLCKSVGDISHWRNLYSKGNSQLLATAEDLYEKALPRSNVLPHLVCRPCERRLTNFRKFKITVSESQASFEVKVKRCLEESPSAPHTIKSLKARKDANIWPEMCQLAALAVDYVSLQRNHRRLVLYFLDVFFLSPYCMSFITFNVNSVIIVCRCVLYLYLKIASILPLSLVLTCLLIYFSMYSVSCCRVILQSSWKSLRFPQVMSLKHR